MNDDFEPAVRDWLRERGRPSPELLASVAGAVAVLPPRHSRPRTPWLVAAAVLVAALGFAALASGPGRGPSPTPLVGAAPSTRPATPEPQASDDATPQPFPAWASNLAGELDCDLPSAAVGTGLGEVAVELETQGREPEGALMLWLGADPTRGYYPLNRFRLVTSERGDGWARVEYRVDGRLKIVALAADHVRGRRLSPSWQLMAMHSCDPSEFDPEDGLNFPLSLWTDRAGRVQPSSVIRSFPPSPLCEWQQVTFLVVGRHAYVEDFNGEVADLVPVPYLQSTTLPPGARDSGYRSGPRELWFGPDESAVYVVSRVELEPGAPQTGIERLPNADEVGCH